MGVSRPLQPDHEVDAGARTRVAIHADWVHAAAAAYTNAKQMPCAFEYLRNALSSGKHNVDRAKRAVEVVIAFRSASALDPLIARARSAHLTRNQ